MAKKSGSKIQKNAAQKSKKIDEKSKKIDGSKIQKNRRLKNPKKSKKIIKPAESHYLYYLTGKKKNYL